jgi:DNA-binding NtrC family response regulator
MQGIELLAQIRRTYPDTNVILMTAFGSVETAIEAMKSGAYDVTTFPASMWNARAYRARSLQLLRCKKLHPPPTSPVVSTTKNSPFILEWRSHQNGYWRVSRSAS